MIALIILAAFVVVNTAISVWALLRTFRRIPVTPDKAKTPIDAALSELLEKSRAAGGRVHIHDVEDVLRRRIG